MNLPTCHLSPDHWCHREALHLQGTCLLTQLVNTGPFSNMCGLSKACEQTNCVSVFSVPSGFAPVFAEWFELPSTCVTMFVHRFLTAVPPEYLLHFPSQSLLDSSLLLSFSSGVLGFTSSWLVFLDPVLIFFLHSSAPGLYVFTNLLKSRILKHFATSQLFYHLRLLSGLEESRCCGVATRLSPLFLCLFLYSVKCRHDCVLQMFPLLSSLGFILCEFLQ